MPATAITEAQMSQVEALWTLIQSQTKKVQKVLAQRMLAQQSLTARGRREQTLIASSFRRGWQEVKEAEQTGAELPSVWDLLDELKDD